MGQTEHIKIRCWRKNNKGKGAHVTRPLMQYITRSQTYGVNPYTLWW